MAVYNGKNAALNYRKKHSREIFEIDENWDSEEDTEKYEAQVKVQRNSFWKMSFRNKG